MRATVANPIGSLDGAKKAKDLADIPWISAEVAEKYIAVNEIESVNIKPIEFSVLDRIESGADLIRTGRKLGAGIDHYELSVYGLNAQGSSRRLDNSDILSDYPYYYGPPMRPDAPSATPVAEALKIADRVKAIAQACQSEFEKIAKASTGSKQIRAASEAKEFSKFTLQRTDAPGRHLSLPFRDNGDMVATSEFRSMVRRVLKTVYAPGFQQAFNANSDPYYWMLQGTDAPNTAVGAPTFASGDQAHASRIATLLAWPALTKGEEVFRYMAKLHMTGTSLGLPHPAMMYSPYLAYRDGLMVKPSKMWFHDGSDWIAKIQSTGMYCRERHVNPASFPVNLIFTPLVLPMKMARRAWLGLWHTPELAAEYVKRLSSQGKIPMEGDFSEYDRTLFNNLLNCTMEEMAHIVPRSWLWFLNYAIATNRESGLISPSYVGTSGVTFIQGRNSLMSGTLLTSELGSVISITMNLLALETAGRSDLVEKFFKQQFLILVQSDDVLFTIDKELSPKFGEYANSLGMDLKSVVGDMFLKRFLPIGDKSGGESARPISRVFNQTFGNEDSYVGDPPELMRFAFAARCEGLHASDHVPDSVFRVIGDTLFQLYPFSGPGVPEGIAEHYRAGFSKGKKLAPHPIDVEGVLRYAMTKDSETYLAKLLKLAEVSASAMALVRWLTSVGVDFSKIEASATEARRQYVMALMKPSSSQAVNSLQPFCKWARTLG